MSVEAILEPKSAYRHALLGALQPRISLRVVHRTFTRRMHPIERRLPQYAQRELASISDRALLGNLPSRLIPVWIEGVLAEHESVTIPLTGWGVDADGPVATLRFERAIADLDTPPLLACSTMGMMQIATELHLLLSGEAGPLRVWRYGVAAELTVAHGKRSIRLLSPDEKHELPGWHAVSEDGAALLLLDAPSYGTDGLADVWHIASVQVALPTYDLYRRLAPRALALPMRPQLATLAQLSFHSADGRCLARGRFPAILQLQAPDRLPAPPLEARRRIETLLIRVTPAASGPLRLMARDLLPRAGIVCALLWQDGSLVSSAAAHYTGALGTVEASWPTVEAVYIDGSGVTQRELLQGRATTGSVTVQQCLSGGHNRWAAPKAPATPTDPLADPHADVDGAVFSHNSDAGASWELELAEPALWMQLPRAAELPGVSLWPRGCQLPWAADVRETLLPRRGLYDQTHEIQ